MRRTRAALILLTLVCPLLLALMSVSGRYALWLAAPLICALPVLLIVIGAGIRQPGPAGLVVLWLLLSGSWLTLVWLSHCRDLTQPAASDALLVVGIMLLGLGLGPLLLVGWLFQRWFSRSFERADGEAQP